MLPSHKKKNIGLEICPIGCPYRIIGTHEIMTYCTLFNKGLFPVFVSALTLSPSKTTWRCLLCLNADRAWINQTTGLNSAPCPDDFNDTREDTMEKEQEQEFWLVWNPGGQNPTCRHGSKESAEDEAERLARTNPTYRFYVLKADSYFKFKTVEKHDLLEEKPF